MLADEEVEEINGESGLGVTNFTAQQWTELNARLPPGPKEPVFYYQFLILANRFEPRRRMMQGPRKNVTADIRDRKRLIKDLRSAVQRVSNLRFDIRGTSTEDILSMNTVIKGLEQDLTMLNFRLSDYQLYPHHRRHFVSSVLGLWQDAGGNIGFSRTSQKPSGPLIRYLTFVWPLLRSEPPPAPETLVALIKDFKRTPPMVSR